MFYYIAIASIAFGIGIICSSYVVDLAYQKTIKLLKSDVEKYKQKNRQSQLDAMNSIIMLNAQIEELEGSVRKELNKNLIKKSVKKFWNKK
jgi:hypothetical protein